MNLKERLAAKQAELVSLKSAIEAGDVDAIAKSESIVAEISDIQSNISKAEKAADLMAKFGNAEPQPVKSAAAFKTLGEFASKNLDFTAIRSGMARSTGTGFAFKAATDLKGCYLLAACKRHARL